MQFAIQGLKMEKTKELSRDIRDRIIECHKGGQGYRKISKEMNLALSTVGNKSESKRSMAPVQQTFQEMEDQEK